MNKQIEEMANDLVQICPGFVENYCGQINCVTHITLSLTKIGWHKHTEGEWLTRTAPITQCSVCGTQRNFEKQSGWNFCPNCGAKMKGAKDEQAD